LVGNVFSCEPCCYPIFDPCFDKFSEKSKNSEKTLKIQKIHFLYICIVFSIFSIVSKEFKFSKTFGTRSTFHASFLKSLIFRIESMLIFARFQKYKKIRKIKIYKKRGKEKEKKS